MQNKEIYVGNLSWSANEEDLTTFFSNYGEIEAVKLIRDRDSGKSRGFAFVRFTTTEAAKGALQANDQMIHNRALRVRVAEPKHQKSQQTTTDDFSIASRGSW